MDLLNKFDDLRMQRMSIAQEFVAQYNDTDELMADIANILALFFAAGQISKKNSQKVEGFRPNSAGFRSDSR